MKNDGLFDKLQEWLMLFIGAVMTLLLVVAILLTIGGSIALVLLPIKWIWNLL